MDEKEKDEKDEKKMKKEEEKEKGIGRRRMKRTRLVP